jgi:hypothetical protein
MRRSTAYFSLLLASAAMGLVALPGCSSGSKSKEGELVLRTSTNSAMAGIYKADPSLQNFVNAGYAFAIFPNIAAGTVPVGGILGRGEVIEQGTFIGYADVCAGTFAATVGGPRYAELIVFQDKASLDKFTSNTLIFPANTPAPAIRNGIGARAKFNNGMAVFKNPIDGPLDDASVSGQQFAFAAAQTEYQ